MMYPEEFRDTHKSKRIISTQGFIGLLLALIILIAGVLFIKSSYFTVGSVIVEGNKYISVEDVYRIADIPESINIFSLNTANIKMRLLHDLRIDETDVSRQFPGTIVITIKERKPMAYVASNYGFLEIDKQGVVLAVLKNLKRINVPMITGIRLENEYVGDKIEDPAVKKIVNYLSLLDEVTLNQLSEINSKSSNEIIVYTLTSIPIHLGNSERLVDKAKLTNEMLRELEGKRIMVEYIDLSYASPVIKFKK